MNAMTRLIAKAETKYSAVTARYISMPREVSSCACMREQGQLGDADTANATEEFLMMFIDSLVSGGMTMRNAIGSST